MKIETLKNKEEACQSLNTVLNMHYNSKENFLPDFLMTVYNIAIAQGFEATARKLNMSQEKLCKILTPSNEISLNELAKILKIMGFELNIKPAKQIFWQPTFIKFNSLADSHPDLAQSWNSQKNKPLTPNDVTAGSNKKVWWQCYKGNDHEWEAPIINRTNGRGCPVCRGLKVVSSNCLATTHPKIAAQWHPTKNGTLTPYNVVAGSNKKAWWRCDQHDKHEWQAVVNKRTTGRNCPYCQQNKTDFLAIKYPETAKLWDKIKNGWLTPFAVKSTSIKQAYWKCSINKTHKWKIAINKQCSINNCPFCYPEKINSTFFNSLDQKNQKNWLKYNSRSYRLK